MRCAHVLFRRAPALSSGVGSSGLTHVYCPTNTKVSRTTSYVSPSNHMVPAMSDGPSAFGSTRTPMARTVRPGTSIVRESVMA